MGYMYALSWKLLIIGLLSEYVATLLKILHLRKIDRKCSIFLHQLYFFFWEGHSFLRDRYQISCGEEKRKGKSGYRGMAKMRVIFAKFPLLSKIQTLSHKLLVR